MHVRSIAAVAFVMLVAQPAAAQPEQVHASWLGDGLVGIAWARSGDVTATSEDIVRVAGPGLEAATIAPLSLAYIAPGVTVHKAAVPLPPGADVLEYSVGSEAGGWSPPFRLALAPVLAADGGRIRIAAFGDQGIGAESNASGALPAAVLAVAPQAVLHLGDIAYADGDPAVWDAWFRQQEPLAAQTLYMAAPGNHEHEGYHVASGPSPGQAAFTGSALDPYEQYRQRFHFPGSDLRYSVDLGPVHVVSLNSEDACLLQPATYPIPWRVSPPCGAESQQLPEDQWQTLPPNQDLLDWLDVDLAAHADAPWTIVFFHRPVYSGGSYAGDHVLQQHFVPLFERHGVDLVLSGHDHNYQRSFPLRGGEPVTREARAYEAGEGPIYVVSGGGGEGYYSLDDDVPPWTANRTEAFHFLVLDADADGFQVSAIGTLTGETIDSFRIGAPRMDAAPPDDDGTPRGTPLPGALALSGLAAALAVRRRTP